jgi:hypothetical protein
MFHAPLPDTGLAGVDLLLGAGWAFLAFVFVSLVEAALMRAYLKTSWARSLGYAFAMNLVSAVLGIPCALTGLFVLPFFAWVVIAYLLTVPIEMLVLRLIWRPAPALSRLLRFTAFANLVSYALLAALTWALLMWPRLRPM